VQSIKKETRLLLDPQRYIRIIAELSNEAVFSYFDTRVSAYATLSHENGALIILEYVMITYKREVLRKWNEMYFLSFRLFLFRV